MSYKTPREDFELRAKAALCLVLHLEKKLIKWGEAMKASAAKEQK